MKRNWILMLVFLLPAMAFSQNETFKGEHFIEVTGSAQQEIEPNEIYTLIRLREFEENKQKVSLEKLDADFQKALKEAGIDKKRLELADAGSRLDKFGKKDKDAFREKAYQLKLTSAAELEKFLEKLEPVKVGQVSITRLHHSDYEKLKVELKMKALQAARSKAEALLKSIGAEIGKPLMIRDWEVEPYQPMMEMKTANMRVQNEMDQSGFAADDAIGFRKIKLQSQITAQFEIK
ncbi:MAG TPA: SIMPL domain-containing protein [Chryseosolibacter sp.]